MKNIKLGLLGLGTVGSGVLQMVQQNADKILDVTGCKLTVKTALVRNLGNYNKYVDETSLTTDFDEILNDDEIKIVVELMGGIHPAKEYITTLLKNHKNVVTANKDLIASYGPELMTVAHENHCDLMFEASVAGGIPILRTIANSFTADKVTEVKGIVNGTTNYILTQMSQRGWSYHQALAQAQQLGFAESDPTNDVTGKDAAYKMIILSQFAFGTQLDIKDIAVEGIDRLNDADVQQAASFGYVIKLLGITKLVNNGVFVEVGPVLIPRDHPLATINNEFNAVMVTAQAVGDTLFYGRGAGGLPTANSVLSDITTVTKNIILGTNGNLFNNYQQPYIPAKLADIKYPYYLSLTLPDVPGQILKLTQMMTDINASFREITQTKDGKIAHIAIITHRMSKEQLQTLLTKVANDQSINLSAAYKVMG